MTLVATRLDRDNLDDDIGLLVLAACEGEAALIEAVAGNAPDLPEPTPMGEPAADPVGAYLASIQVEGFRGVGEARNLELSPGPGLTLVVGRNGSGKSSFVEALEVLLTGESRRWTSRREKAWREGWRNLHHPEPTVVQATFATDGMPGITTVTRAWKAGAKLDDGTSTAQIQSQPKGPLSALGWADALVANRPILSYNELGSILDEGPSHLFDALAGILGLDDVTDSVERLRKTRLALKKTVDAARGEATRLVLELTDLDDDRASRCVEAMKGRSWDLETVAAVVTGTGDEPDSTSDVEVLRRFTQLTGPDRDLVATAIDRARSAADERDRVAGSDAETADRIASLLRTAVEHHDHAGDGRCPVCGVGVLDDTWLGSTMTEIERLDRAAREARHAVRSEADAKQQLASIQLLPQVSLPEATRLKLDADATRRVWEQWVDVDTSDLRVAADRFEALAPQMEGAVETLRSSAAKAHAEREDRWKPIAEEVASWLARARSAERVAQAAPKVTLAENWLAATTDELRAERLAPIQQQAASVWEQLSQDSNVTLGPITLTGKGPSRRVTLDVKVDGVDSVALSVMSQGELHALALAIFLPRATQPESPFRFLVVDDPVQAMDPAKVDGLARVLETTAVERQVVVFTHDDRLPQAVRRLGIEATVLQVTRRDRSIVEIRHVGDPASVYIDDAFALALTDDLPEDARRRVVPGYCRHAVEAVLNDVVRRKQLSIGVPHAEVEQGLVNVTTLNTRAALALFGDSSKGGDVLSRLGAFGAWAQDAYQACNRGSHDGFSGNLKGLVRDTERLVDKLRGAP